GREPKRSRLRTIITSDHRFMAPARCAMTAEDIAKVLGGRTAGASWLARCPAHKDRKPRLSREERRARTALDGSVPTFHAVISSPRAGLDDVGQRRLRPTSPQARPSPTARPKRERARDRDRDHGQSATVQSAVGADRPKDGWCGRQVLHPSTHLL